MLGMPSPEILAQLMALSNSNSAKPSRKKSKNRKKKKQTTTTEQPTTTFTTTISPLDESGFSFGFDATIQPIGNGLN